MVIVIYRIKKNNFLTESNFTNKNYNKKIMTYE